MPVFKYALVNRPPGIGCVPRGLLFAVEPRPPAGAPHHAMARHGILVSERALTPEELKSFELARIVDGPMIEEFAESIAAGPMQEYATETLAAHADDPEDFRRGVLHAAEQLEPGIACSIGDEGALFASVLARLRALVSKHPDGVELPHARRPRPST